MRSDQQIKQLNTSNEEDSNDNVVHGGLNITFAKILNTKYILSLRSIDKCCIDECDNISNLSSCNKCSNKICNVCYYDPLYCSGCHKYSCCDKFVSLKPLEWNCSNCL
jgi:hypothetical protein